MKNAEASSDGKKAEGPKEGHSSLKMSEFSKTVSQQTKINEASVRKTLRAALAVLTERIEEGERTRVQGLGVFIRRAGKEEGTSRIRFQFPKKDVATAKEEEED